MSLVLAKKKYMSLVLIVYHHLRFMRLVYTSEIGNYIMLDSLLCLLLRKCVYLHQQAQGISVFCMKSLDIHHLLALIGS